MRKNRIALNLDNREEILINNVYHIMFDQKFKSVSILTFLK